MSTLKLWSDNWRNGAFIPLTCSAGRPDGQGGATFSDNHSPHLAWSGAPSATQSFALICHDPDVPSRGDDVNQPDREVPAELPRVDFFHWVLIDLPPQLHELQEGEFSQGFTPRGKPGPTTLHQARHGLNSYTDWFAGDAQRAGQYFGYDGPFPPFNDALVHRYVFTLFALSVARLPIEGVFTGPQAREALAPHVLAEASHVGRFTLNRRLL